jgi:serine/threonine protein kinase/Tol biopolymer transport system component
MVSRSISHYHVLRKLGEGGMGEVYLAEDARLGRKVALKVLPADAARNPERMHRFVQEAKAASSLNHPNIAHIYEIGESDGINFIAMEFVEGTTLRQQIHRQRVDLPTLLKYLAQVAEGLAKAHAAGIVHRDLKPDNIMISPEGYAKILDFGLAKLVETTLPSADDWDSNEAPTAMIPAPLSTPGMIMGTVGYMSPEQAQGRTEIDPRSDVFSFGCMLFEAATRKQPFAANSLIDTLHQLIHAPAPAIRDFNAEAPAELQRIVRRCLAKDPDERYQSIKDVAIELKDLQRDLSSGAAIESSVAPEPPEVMAGSNRRYRAVALAALIIVLCAGLGYAIYHFTRAGKPAALHFQNVKLTRLTAEGNVESVAVSPDGKYVAYSLEESGQRSLWTKHPATASRVQIVPPAEALAMTASTFSPDGSYVYYTKIDEQNPQGALYQVPVLGGVSKKILSDVGQPVAISRDGKQLAFERLRRSGTADEIFLANVDGTGERRLLEVREPLWLVGGAPAWSPDGRSLAIGYGDGQAMVLAVVSVADGTLRTITRRGWLFIGSVGWLADGSAVAFTAREQVLGALQVWQASYPQGDVRTITNDLNSYAAYSLSLIGDGSGVVAVQGDPISNIWVGPDGDTSHVRAVTSRKNVQEGHYALSWTADGKLLYDTDVNGKSSIWVMNADGTDAKALTDAAADDYAPQASPDGRTIIFGSRRTNLYQVWRMDADGGNPKQLTQETGVPTFSVSPDGRWVIYSPFIGGIRKVSVDGGPAAVVVAEGDQRNAQLSPDGKLLAYFFNDEQTKRPKLGVINPEGGEPLKTFALPVASLGIYDTGFSTLYRGFHWSPDGRALVYINTLSGVSNLWRQPLDGSTPVQITDFKSDLIYNFAYARDGSALALARGSHVRDAVLISEMK